VIAAVQIQSTHTDLNPYIQSINDTFGNINQNYIYKQIKATTAIAGHLTQPISFEYKIHLPLVWQNKF
jgi:hypothetical protein